MKSALAGSWAAAASFRMANGPAARERQIGETRASGSQPALHTAIPQWHSLHANPFLDLTLMELASQDLAQPL